jgi:sarcosine oxidase
VAPLDVVVVGLGAMGSAALHHLARRGLRTLGIEQFSPGHDRGSSHGATRIIRLGYFEDPSYVPLVRAAYPLWRELEAEAREQLLTVTGIVEIGAPDGELINGTLASARLHGLAHEVLDAAAVMRRFPAFRIPSHYVGVFQGDGGFLAAEAAIHAQLRLARAAGAEIRTNERVRAVEPAADGVRIVTERGTIKAAQAIVAAGSWLPVLLPQLPMRLRVTRQVLGWFTPTDGAPFTADKCPVFLLESGDGMFYGFPPHGGSGIKFAKHHHQDETIDPEAPTRPFSPDDEAILRHALAAHLPAANGALIDAKICRYTMTPDGDFLLDRLPGAKQIIIASPCSGHGFKFAPVIGQALADLVERGETWHDLSRFRLRSFASR